MIGFASSSNQDAENGTQAEVPMRSVSKEHLSPEEFLETLEARRGKIESAQFVSPKLGDSHFGYFEVDYRRPIFKSVQRP
jgi:hypothetical protein